MRHSGVDGRVPFLSLRSIELNSQEQLAYIFVSIAILITAGIGFGVMRVVRRLKEDIQHDIAERKRTENALRESNDKFHQLADNITDVFWIRSPDMREVQYVSKAFERIWGRSVESLYANPHQWTDFILPEDRERVMRLLPG
ncbi:MAG: PAS domain-containing protein [Limisphaerales bacterium]